MDIQILGFSISHDYFKWNEEKIKQKTLGSYFFFLEMIQAKIFS
jgi:hypothetical protein